MASSVDYSKYYYRWSTLTHHWYQFGNENHIWAKIHNHLSSFFTGSRRTPFLEGVCFDETSHIILHYDDYIKLKDSLEGEIGRTLPIVGNTRLSSTNPRTQPVHVRNINQLKDITRRLNQRNNVIRRRQQDEAKRHELKVKEFLKNQPAADLLALDVEMYEHDHSMITEIGFVVFRYKQEDKAEHHHYIVEENLKYVNKDHVPDNRDGFMFGTSKTAPLEEVKTALKEQLELATAVVGHYIIKDTDVLEGISIKDKFLIDTQELALAQASKPMPMSLGHVLDNYGVPCDKKNLHNAGNDCHYTMKAFAALTRRY